jgi:hypothetical protein
MAVFRSAAASLVVYHEGAKVATFVDGLFETNDPKVAAVLREHEQVTEELKGKAAVVVPVASIEPAPGSGTEGAAPTFEPGDDDDEGSIEASRLGKLSAAKQPAKSRGRS